MTLCGDGNEGWVGDPCVMCHVCALYVHDVFCMCTMCSVCAHNVHYVPCSMCVLQDADVVHKYNNILVPVLMFCCHVRISFILN